MTTISIGEDVVIPARSILYLERASAPGRAIVHFARDHKLTVAMDFDELTAAYDAAMNPPVKWDTNECQVAVDPAAPPGMPMLMPRGFIDLDEGQMGEPRAFVPIAPEGLTLIPVHDAIQTLKSSGLELTGTGFVVDEQVHTGFDWTPCGAYPTDSFDDINRWHSFVTGCYVPEGHDREGGSHVVWVFDENGMHAPEIPGMWTSWTWPA